MLTSWQLYINYVKTNQNQHHNVSLQANHFRIKGDLSHHHHPPPPHHRNNPQVVARLFEIRTRTTTLTTIAWRNHLGSASPTTGLQPVVLGRVSQDVTPFIPNHLLMYFPYPTTRKTSYSSRLCCCWPFSGNFCWRSFLLQIGLPKWICFHWFQAEKILSAMLVMLVTSSQGQSIFETFGRIHLFPYWTAFGDGSPFPYWLMVSTLLKNISQNGNLPQIGVKIKIFETTTQLIKVDSPTFLLLERRLFLIAPTMTLKTCATWTHELLGVCVLSMVWWGEDIANQTDLFPKPGMILDGFPSNLKSSYSNYE